MPQIRSMNYRFHSEAKLPWSYDYPLANHIVINNSAANREVPVFVALPFFRVSLENFPEKGFKILPITAWCLPPVAFGEPSWPNGMLELIHL